jgi:hypothetical protein
LEFCNGKVYLEMNKPCLFALIYVISFLDPNCSWVTNLFPVKNKPVHELSGGKYVLHIDQFTVASPKDTLIYGEKIRLARFVLKLTNNTNDTLKYIGMSCSWWDIYHINNDRIGSFSSVCEKNIPTVIKLPPHQTSKIDFPLKIAKGKDAHGEKFKIGINIVPYKSWSQLSNSSVWNKLSSKNNLIWSNEVVIP